MITTTFVPGIIFLSIAATALIFCTVLSLTRNYKWFLSWLFSLFLIIPGIAMVCETPKDSDVLSKKAHYVEVYNIDNNDTIKTYYIKWDTKIGEMNIHH